MAGPRPGSAFDRYLVEELLGEGGMGAVYRARDTVLERPVALKVLRTEDGAAARRLLREARAAAALDHPNVVAIYDVGEVDDRAFLAMELIDGRTLRAWIGDPEVPVATRLRWLREIASALAAAHARGLVHRDVKPENVMIRRDGAVRVLDFGIARREAEGGAAESRRGGPPSGRVPLHAPESAEGLAGTPRYMAPEQLWGEAVDGRADQFAWGVVAYELLTGRLPWQESADPSALVAEIVSRVPPALEPGAAPEVVRGAVARALAKDPAARFASMDDVVRALATDAEAPLPPRHEGRADGGAGPPRRELGTTRGVTATHRSAPPPPRGRWRRGVAVLAAVAAALGIGALALRSTPPQRPPEAAASGSSRGPATEAEELLRAGRQAVHDASIMAGVRSFERALALDPSLAQAHLATAIWTSGLDPEAGRRHYERARLLRSRLTPREQAILHALEPKVVSRPQDPAEGEARTIAALARFAGDAELTWLLALFRYDRGHTALAIQAADQAVALDPTYALALWTRSAAEEAAGKDEDALTSLARCLAISPAAGSCLRSRATLREGRGECAAARADAERMTAVEPDGHRAWEFLGRELAATGELAGAREALRKRWSLLSEAQRGPKQALDEAELALLSGDFASALAHADALEKQLGPAAAEQEHAEVARVRLVAHEETGDVAAAVRTAQDFLARRTAWAHGYYERARDPTGQAIAALRAAGAIGRSEAAARRGTWLEEVLASDTPNRGDVWVVAFGRPAADASDAAEALRALPSFAPLRPSGAYALGRVHLLAGDWDAAIRELERAAKSCLALTEPVETVRAEALLARARAAKRDPAACAGYRAVVARWGDAKPRSATAEEARRRLAECR